MGLLLATAIATGQAPGGEEAPAPRYDRDIRPLLADRCFRCHGPDAGSRRAELRLDDRAAACAARDGGAAIVPGDAAASELWRRISHADPDERMPPADSGRRALTPAERERVRRWIDDGAHYEPHWSFVPPTRPPVPPVAVGEDHRNPVDAFVLERLRHTGLEPNPAEEPRRLLRRLFLCLTGLPPEPEDLAAFELEPTPGAYDRWVDRLLAEEPYRTRTAERLATPWLDAARYADTSGIHTDAGRQMWVYRDWVLRALRDNMPLDRFAIEQLAGDLLPEATQDQHIASGFQRCHVTTDEGGAIAEEYLVEYAVDRTATAGSVFLGLSLGCARCHEHKFDPISQDEFYGLFAYFNSIDEPGLYSQLPDSNRAFEPAMRVPTAAQTQELDQLRVEIDAARAARDAASPDDERLADAWTQSLAARLRLRWHPHTVLEARSAGASTLTVEPDGTIGAGGANPATDVHTVRLRTEARDLRLLCLEALPDPASPGGKVGRADNGNAVLQSIAVEAVSRRDPTQRQPVPLTWAWASVEQPGGDHHAVNALLDDDGVGWAVDAHRRPAAPCAALFAAEAPFGYAGGTELVVTLRYDSIWAQHTLARVRLSLGSIDAAALELLPEAVGAWYRCGPFAATGSDDAWERGDGPEAALRLDRAAVFATGAATDDQAERLTWQHEPAFADDRLNELAAGQNRSYVARELFAPTPRTRELALGSDDGFRLHLDGREVAGRRVERGVARDQDRATITIPAGRHLLTMKIVNTGGEAGCYQRPTARSTALGPELHGDLAAALLPDAARQPLRARLRAAWRLSFSPGYGERQRQLLALEQQLATAEAAVPQAMVMRELPAPRPTFVLQRGQYDQPDRTRPVRRSVPAALGRLPDGAPEDRRGLAQWLVDEQNPLFLRVQANRLFELVFGTGIVRTSDDFGMQGEWPSHPELLDWLSIELRASGHDLRHVLRLLCTSATFRRSSRHRPDLAAVDPDNRLLARFPRRRLSAEQLRDQALYVSGLLVESFGGPSVKPYQPPGLWREVAMPASNTRTFERGSGAALWRRSLYTYHKRASPPPAMATFDAPTREVCTTRRSSTNTPLQALVLWNDEQFVEAARVLAQRTAGAESSDDARIAALFVRCTGEPPEQQQLQRTRAALQALRDRFAAAPADAAALLAIGEAPIATDLPPAELAALTLLANAVLTLDATICTP